MGTTVAPAGFLISRQESGGMEREDKWGSNLEERVPVGVEEPVEVFGA
jgi:hypothetical protein